MMAVERVKTGISGFDDLVSGGIPKGSVTLISGGAGTGKTTFAMEFAYRGALKGERGLFIGTEQSVDDLKKHALQFGWNLNVLKDRELLDIAYFDFTKEDSKIEEIEKLCKKLRPKRVVIDSLTTLIDSYIGVIRAHRPEAGEHIMQNSFSKLRKKIFSTPIAKESITKQVLFDLFNTLHDLGVTSMLTTELLEETESLSRDTMSEFMSDGVVVLKIVTTGAEALRTVEVRKMRNTNADITIHNFRFTPKGIKVERP